MARSALPNVEPSLYRKGEYNAYDASGHVWHCRKVKDKQWRAMPAPNNPARHTGKAAVIAETLTALSQMLAVRPLPVQNWGAPF